MLSTAGQLVGLGALLTGAYVAVHSADDSSAELGLARQAAGFTAATPALNAGIIQFPAAVGDKGTATHFGVWTAATNGTFIGAWPLSASHQISDGVAPRFPIGSLEVTIS